MRRSVFVMVACVGCGVTEATAIEEEVETGAAQQKEEWASGDSPQLFGAGLELELDALPVSGEAAQVPWAGSYWPVSGDTINHRWAGASSESPAKKYERAFGLSGVEDAVSRDHGIDGATAQRTCTRDADCNEDACGKRAGRPSGRCIPRWWGICHAWAPAAILWPEPRGPVTKNGVRFEVQDLKALASLVHDRTRTRFAAQRCDSSLGDFATDHYGRPLDGACRDTNAGTFHVLLANYLGRMRQSFVEDRTIDAEVWNQPLRSYRVVSKRVLTPAEVARYPFNAKAKRLVALVTDVRYITESEASVGWVGPTSTAYTATDRYEYVLELDAAGKIIGGEWSGASVTAHPDFLWLPLGARDAAVAEGKIEYEKVKALVLESAAAGAAQGGKQSFTLAAGAWRTFGPFAPGAVAVELTGTGDGDLYVRSGGPASASVFDCRPYTSASRERCSVTGSGPLYVAVHAAAASSLTLEVVRAARLSVASTVAERQLRTFTLAVRGGRAVVVRTTSARDVDLFVRLGATPTTQVFDGRGDTPSGNEAVRLVPASAGTLVIGVYGYEAASFTLTAAEE
ncbi:MAG: hypothetical protein JNK82_10540 [Myxococcaceae bacterium]|nr:hypothetical protein [Myxococcaceae bacterium]